MLWTLLAKLACLTSRSPQLKDFYENWYRDSCHGSRIQNRHHKFCSKVSRKRRARISLGHRPSCDPTERCRRFGWALYRPSDRLKLDDRSDIRYHAWNRSIYSFPPTQVTFGKSYCQSSRVIFRKVYIRYWARVDGSRI